MQNPNVPSSYRTFRVVLDVTVNLASISSPESWNWETMLISFPEEEHLAVREVTETQVSVDAVKAMFEARNPPPPF